MNDRSGHQRESGTDHLTLSDIAAYVDGVASPLERRRIEEHAADCPECGEEILAAAHAVRPKRGLRRAGMSIALAAGLATLLFLRPGSTDLRQTPPAFRDGGQAPVRVQVLSPADRATVGSGETRFVWRPAAAEASYTFQITNEIGDVLWEGQTPDTTLDLARHLLLRRGQRYFWRVDALLPDGTEAGSGAHELRISP